LADSRLKDENATCPNCRCDIGLDRCVRNLAAEKAIGELPTECTFCSATINRSEIEAHERHNCTQRPSKCYFHWAGCEWKGSFDKLAKHAVGCDFRFRPVEDVKEKIEEHVEEQAKATRFKSNILILFSSDNVMYLDIQLRSYRSDDYISRLYFESNRIRCGPDEWVMKAFISCCDQNPQNPTISMDRSLTFQLILKNRPNFPKDLQFFVTKAPSSDFQIEHVTYLHRFADNALESPAFALPLTSPAEVNRFIASKFVNLRVFFFEMAKEENRRQPRPNQQW